jgi:hypothetical protein
MFDKDICLFDGETTTQGGNIPKGPGACLEKIGEDNIEANDYATFARIAFGVLSYFIRLQSG